MKLDFVPVRLVCPNPYDAELYANALEACEAETFTFNGQKVRVVTSDDLPKNKIFFVNSQSMRMGEGIIGVMTIEEGERECQDSK